MSKKSSKKNSVWSYIVLVFIAIFAFFKFLFFVLSIPFKLCKGIEEIVRAVKAIPQKA